MKKNILFACDLEGVNNVVGEPFNGLSKGSAQWEIARKQITLEINAAAQVLFDLGVEKIDVWDNHGGGNNIDPCLLDVRIHILDVDASLNRMYFAAQYDGVFYFGYHAMEGTLGGVLAHTMNSKEVQYYKLNGRQIGEIDMDAYIAASHGVPSCFFVGGDIACAQAIKAIPEIITVETKKEISRNDAVFRNNEELLEDIKKNVEIAINGKVKINPLSFPATIEKCYKRTEHAAEYLKRLRIYGIECDHPDSQELGKDAHSVVAIVNSIEEFIRCI